MRDTMNVVVLAAGRGERFAAAGVTVPKPLIEFRGVTLLQRSVDLARELRSGSGRVIVVATPAVAPHARALDGVDYVVEASVTQRGPAASGLLAMAHLPPEEPVTFMDCDNYYPGEARSWVYEIPIGRDFITIADAPPSLSMEQFCNVGHDELGVVTRMREKVALHGPRIRVATGVYGFASAAHFQQRAGMLTHMQEIPMSEALRGGAIFVVPVDAWHPVGTPSQLVEAARHVPQSPTTNE